MEIFLKGNYKSFSKLLVTRSTKKNNKVLFNLHGLYGLSGDHNSKSRKLAEVVTKAGKAHVVNFNSSRDWGVFEDGNWEKMKKAFEGKTFEQELQDAKDAVEVVVDQSQELFGINSKDLELYIVGNSLGGVVATCLAEYFKITKAIVLAGSETRTVFPTKLTEKQILDNASKFRGKVMLIQGSKDDVVPLEAGDALLLGYTSAKTKKLIVEGANHQFSKINGKDKRKAFNQYIEAILQFIF